MPSYKSNLKVTHMPSVYMSMTHTNIPLWCEWTVPLATMSMPPLCSRSPEKFPWMPSALAYKKQRKQAVRSLVSVWVSATSTPLL